MSHIRMGIIGCGGMTGSHLQGLAMIGDRMTITSVCDIDPEKVRLAADLTGAGVAVTDYREILPFVDAVLIALPHDLHYEVGMACLEAGKHVLMEKPMCNTERECLTLIETAERNKLTLMTAYPVRFWPVIGLMKQYVDNKTYGDVFQMSIWTEQYTRYSPGHWAHSKVRLGGGQFFSHGCHYIDLLLWFLGQPIGGAHIGTRKGTPWLEGEGTSNVVLEFESGTLGYHFGTWGARGTRLGYSIHIHCTEGMLEYDSATRKLILHSQIHPEKANLDTSSHSQVLYEQKDTGKLTQYEIIHFLDCIHNSRQPLTDGTSSLQGLRVIWRLYEAEQNGTIADLRGLGLNDDWKAFPKAT